MEDWNTCTPTISDLWLGSYSIIRTGDLVYVGPVHKKYLGLAIERKTVEFGYEPDEWCILINGKIEIYSMPYISLYSEYELLKNNYRYDYYEYKGVENG